MHPQVQYDEIRNGSRQGLHVIQLYRNSGCANLIIPMIEGEGQFK
jgi:hypothetical protein